MNRRSLRLTLTIFALIVMGVLAVRLQPQPAALADDPQSSNSRTESAGRIALLEAKQALESAGQPRADGVRAVPVHDQIENAITITQDTYVHTVNTVDATSSPNDPEPQCGSTYNSNTVWYRFTPGSPGPVLLSTAGSDYDTVLSVYQGSPSSLAFVACNDDFSNVESQLEFSAAAGRTYYIEVADFGNPDGGNLNFSFSHTPSVPISVPLDIVLVQDETGSMSDDISNLRTLAPEIWDSVDALAAAGFRMSVIGFQDYAYLDYGAAGDWVYRRIINFTTDRSVFVSGVNTLVARGGDDAPEAQLATLNYLLSTAHPCIDSNQDGDCADSNDTPSNQQPDFRSGATRVILFATDAGFHDSDTEPQYPGPSGEAVKRRLQDSRAIFIGLVPNGAGQVPEVDELARLTGGSTQATGSSGQEVAAAIVAALNNIRPVSADLSSVTVTPSQLPADGVSQATVRVVVRDTLGQPVPRRIVRLISSRGAQDVLQQPTALSDENGVVTGTIASSVAGTTTIEAVDMIDSVYFSERPSVTFQPETINPSQDLARQIDVLHNISTGAVDDIERTVMQTGEHGDFFNARMDLDKAFRAINLVLNMVGIKSDLDSVAAATTHHLSGLLMEENIVWERVTALVTTHPDGSAYFNLRLEQLVITTQIMEVTEVIVYDGLRFLVEAASNLSKEYVQELGKEALQDLLEEFIASRTDGWSVLAERSVNASNNLQSAVAEQHAEVAAGVPAMSPAAQRAYADELQRRAKVPIVLQSALFTEGLLVDSIQGNYEGIGGGLEVFVLKFIGKALAGTVFDGPGVLLFDGATTRIDYYFDSKKIEFGERAMAAVPGVMKRAAESTAQIYTNEVGGYSRIMEQLPPRPAVGRIDAVRHVSVGSDWGGIYFSERASYSEVDVTNTGSEPAVFALYVEYSYFDRLLGMPLSYIPMTAYDYVVIDPGQTKTMHVDYKEEERGGSPKKDSSVSMQVLATNETGTFYIDSRFDRWDPVQQSRTGERLLLAADTVTLENPIDVYAMGGDTSSDYEIAIWAANPFTQTISTTIVQPLPASVAVDASDGIVADGAVTWNLEIAALDVISGSIKLTYDGPPGAQLKLEPATMTFVEPVSAATFTAESNAAELTGAWPITVEAEVPDVAFHSVPYLPVTVTNLTDSRVEGELVLTVRNENGIAREVRWSNMSIAPASVNVISLQLPAYLRPGAYLAEISAEIDGGERMFIQTPYTITGSSMWIPFVTR